MTGIAFKPLLSLFYSGSCRAGDKHNDRLLDGIAHPSTDRHHWIISQRLLRVRASLSNDGEAVAAILATDLESRRPWAQIAAARCKEAGQLADRQALVQLVTRLDGAAAWVEAASGAASLAPTRQAALERELWGMTAEQAQATPLLVRVLAEASRLTQWQGDALASLSPLDPTGIKTDQNWCKGRMLAMPQTSPASPDYILSGGWDGADNVPVMPWVLSTPWAFLLAVVGYVQDAWTAEGRGGLLLELPAGQQAYQPTEIQVLVVGPEGAEVLCGNLGGFLLRIISRLNMALFPIEPSESEINARLSPLIGELLRRKVWRYREGLSGEQGFYQLHPEFSDACYQIAGARSFDLYGRGLRRAVREQAEQWRIDRQRSGVREGMVA